MDDLFESRMEICRRCPLYKIDSVYGPVCNKRLYISEEDKLTVTTWPRAGFKKGCGCKLNWKAKNANAHCIVNKW